MKTLSVCLLLLSITISVSVAQTAKDSLRNDLSFRQVLIKSIRYPQAAQREGKVAKAYIGFKIDRGGKVSSIRILNESSVDASFKLEINRFMEQLPSQKQAYIGEYILPVVFALEGTGKVVKPTEEDNTFVQRLNKKFLINEVYVTGYL